MFKGYAPLSSLSAKIDMGLWHQLYPTEVRGHLHKLRELRNDAAHETSAISFENQSIKARCENMIATLPNVVWAAMQHQMALTSALRMMPAEPSATVLFEDGHESKNFSLRLDPPTTREKYLVCVKAAVWHLHSVTEFFERIRLVLSPLPDKPA
jgi:hypothetical protein